jgi:hypothetical protein
MGASKRYSRQLVEPGQAFLAIPVEPLSDGLGRCLKDFGGWLYAVLDGVFDHPQPKIEFVSFIWHSYRLFKVV